MKQFGVFINGSIAQEGTDEYDFLNSYISNPIEHFVTVEEAIAFVKGVKCASIYTFDINKNIY